MQRRQFMLASAAAGLPGLSVADDFSKKIVASACNKPVYLTFDTGHMGIANLVADFLYAVIDPRIRVNA